MLKAPACLTQGAQTLTREGRGKDQASPSLLQVPAARTPRLGERRDGPKKRPEIGPIRLTPGRIRAAGGGHAPRPGRTCVAASVPRPGDAGGRSGRVPGPPGNRTCRTRESNAEAWGGRGPPARRRTGPESNQSAQGPCPRAVLWRPRPMAAERPSGRGSSASTALKAQGCARGLRRWERELLPS